MDQSPWQLRLFGTFELQRDGAPIDVFGARRDEQVLAYLAVKAPTPLSRDAIASDLWPEVDSATARKNLSFNLFALKKRLADHGLDDPVEEQRKNLRISSSLGVDAMSFGEYLAGAAVTSSAAERVILLEQAASMYGGGLLPGLDFPWLTPHRMRFESLFRDTMSLLAEATYSDTAMRGLIQHIPPTAWQTAPHRRQHSEAGVPSPVELQLPPPGMIDLAEVAAFAREAEAGMQAPEGRGAWVNQVAQRQPEVEAALRRALETENFEAAFGIAVPLWRYWYLRSSPEVGQRWLELLLDAPYTPPVEVRARALHASGTLANYAGRRHIARSSLEQAVSIWRQLDNAAELLRSLTNLAITLYGLDNLDVAREVYAQCIALAEGLGKSSDLVVILGNAALCEIQRGDAEAARGLLERRLLLLGGEDAKPGAALATTLAQLAAVELLEGNLDAAETRAGEASGLFTAAGDDRGRALGDRLLGRVAYNRGDMRRAQELMEESVKVARASNSLWELGSSLGYLAVVLEADGQEQAAASTMWHAVTVLRATGDRGAIQRFKTEIEVIKKGRGGNAPPALGAL